MGWIELLEAALFNGHNAGILLKLAPAFYEALAIPDRVARTERLQERAIRLLIKEKQFATALAPLRDLAERQAKLEAVCHEGLSDFRAAAECHLIAGNLKEALNCYRSIPDLDAALKLVAGIGEHPAAESLQWISRLRQLIAEGPEKFIKTVTPAEKKLLEELLERPLELRGASRAASPNNARATEEAHTHGKAEGIKQPGCSLIQIPISQHRNYGGARYKSVRKHAVPPAPLCESNELILTRRILAKTQTFSGYNRELVFMPSFAHRDAMVR